MINISGLVIWWTPSFQHFVGSVLMIIILNDTRSVSLQSPVYFSALRLLLQADDESNSEQFLTENQISNKILASS